MSAWGRADAAERWHDGDFGPESPMARSTKRVCRDCGFFLPLTGSLGAMFGVCGNELSADGHVVDRHYGCGAHSEAVLTGSTTQATLPVIDEFGYDLVELPGVSVEETVFEPLSRETYPEEN